MCTWNSRIAATAALAALLAAPGGFAQPADRRSFVKVHLLPDSPVSLISFDWSESRASERGSAVILNLNTSLSLKNSGSRRIRAVTWMVSAQEVTPGGRASVTRASLDVGPGETFPLRVDLRLLRPLTGGPGPMVEMTLDGVLFDDLTFYGPNRLDSRRVMTAFELEAQRDRRYFRQILESKGSKALQQECLASMTRQEQTPGIDVRWARTPRVTAGESERDIRFAFLRMPGAPVEPIAGMAKVVGNEARSPRIEFENKSRRAVRYLEVGWILRDQRGREFLAGSVPAKTNLAPGQRVEVSEQSSLQFTESAGGTLSIDGMTGFVSQVEFSDGDVWVPSRSNAGDPRLDRALSPSAEEQRLVSIYRKRGLAALVEELKKY